jgi:hypothetical protein
MRLINDLIQKFQVDRIKYSRFTTSTNKIERNKLWEKLQILIF